MSVRSEIESDNEVHGSCDVRYLWFSLCSKYINFCIWTAEIERSQDTVSAGFSLEFWLLEFFIELNWNWLVTLKFTSVDHKPVGGCQMCEVRKLNWTENLQMVLVPDGNCNTITFYYIFASYCIQQRWYSVQFYSYSKKASHRIIESWFYEMKIQVIWTYPAMTLTG